MSDEIIHVTKTNAIKAFNKSNPETQETLKSLFEGQVNFVKTWKDITSWEACCEIEGIDPFDIYYSNGNKSESAARKIKRMTKTANRLKNGKDWIPDYSNGNQRKWVPYFVWDGSLNGGSGGFRFFLSGLYSAYAYAGSGSAFCFSDSVVSDFAGEAWLPLYIDATF